MECKFQNTENHRCELLAYFKILVDPASGFCVDKCGPNNKHKQLKLLRAFGVEEKHISEVPDSLEDFHAKIESGVINRIDVKHRMIGKGVPCGTCGQIKNILKGFSKLAAIRIFGDRPKDKKLLARGEVCAVCEHRTWLNMMEWGIGFVKDKDLPINHEPGKYDVLWCSVCKCCIEAKILVPDEKCPMDKWDIQAGQGGAK